MEVEQEVVPVWIGGPSTPPIVLQKRRRTRGAYAQGTRQISKAIFESDCVSRVVVATFVSHQFILVRAY